MPLCYDETYHENNTSYMRYYFRRIGCNNYTLILPKGQIKMRKTLILAHFVSENLIFGYNYSKN